MILEGGNAVPVAFAVCLVLIAGLSESLRQGVFGPGAVEIPAMGYGALALGAAFILRSDVIAIFPVPGTGSVIMPGGAGPGGARRPALSRHRSSASYRSALQCHRGGHPRRSPPEPGCGCWRRACSAPVSWPLPPFTRRWS